MTTGAIVSITAILGALILAARGLIGRGVTVRRAGMMAAAWILIIAALAFVLGRLGA